MNFDIFSDSIKEHLEIYSITKKEFAKRANVSERNVCLWVNKTNYPNLDSLIKVANYLNYSLDYLLGRNDQEKYYPSAQPTNFLLRLQGLIEKEGVHPNRIARICNFRNSNFSKWKKGTQPKPEILSALADYFNVSVDYLVGRSDSI